MSERNDDILNQSGDTEEPAGEQETQANKAEQEDKQPEAAASSSEESKDAAADTAPQQPVNGSAQPQQNYNAGPQNPQWQNGQWGQWQQGYHSPYQNSRQGYYYQPPYTQPPQWQGSEYHQSYVSPGQPNPAGYNGKPPEEQPKRKMKKGTKAFLWVVGGLAACFVLTFSIFGMVNAFGNRSGTGLHTAAASSSAQGGGSQNSATNPSWSGLTLEDPQALDGSNTLSAKAVFEKEAPSVVGIVISQKDSQLLNSTEVSEGSGIIISSDGYIVTNSHVVGDSKDYIVDVVLNNGQNYSGTVVGFDTKTDLAVVKIDASDLPVAELGNSDQLSVGDWVIAIGNPGGLEYANSLTRGVVSAINRKVESNAMMKYIQTDAAINPGNSGGALLNMYGQVVGINTVKIVDESYEGMGFAIPINSAKSIVDDLIKQGYISGRVRLGVTCVAITDAQVQQYGVPHGILIRDFASDSVLSAKGVQAGDIITKLNGTEVTSLSKLYEELAKCKPGDKATLTIYRAATSRTIQAKTFDVTITLLEDKGETQQSTPKTSSQANP